MKRVLLIGAALTAMNMTFAGWQTASNGVIPPYAWRVGYDQNQRPLYLCKAHLHGSALPGQLRAGDAGCRVIDQGRAHFVQHYALYTRRNHDAGFWRWAQFYLPQRAWRVGRDLDGRPLYACRARLHGGLYVGKTWKGAHHCVVSPGHFAQRIKRYQVYVMAGA